MLYKFKTRNSGDVIMTQVIGDQVLRAAGREPSPSGIFEPAAMGAAIAAIEAAVAAEAAAIAEATDADADSPKDAPGSGLGLRQRAWPLLEMLRRSQTDGEPIVWGV